MKTVKITRNLVKGQTDGFSTFQISKMLGIPRTNLQQYLDRGLWVPSIRRAYGKGTRNRFSIDDLFTLNLFRRLHKRGFSQREASDTANKIRFNKVGDKEQLDYLIVADTGGDVVIQQVDVRMKEQYASMEVDEFLSINLHRLKKKVLDSVR